MIDPADIPLRDIHIPSPISWWPVAPGWWIVLAVLLVMTALGIAVSMWFKRHRVRRAALLEFSAIEKRFAEHQNTHRLARELSRLARRIALAYDPQRDSAAVIGVAWGVHLNTLNESVELDGLIESALLRAPYSPNESLDGNAVLRAIRPWFAGLRQPSESNS